MDALYKAIVEALARRGQQERDRREEWERSLKPTQYLGNNLFQEMGGQPIEGRYLGKRSLIPGQFVPNIGKNPNKPVIPGLPNPVQETIEEEVVFELPNIIVTWEALTLSTFEAGENVDPLLGEFVQENRYNRYPLLGQTTGTYQVNFYDRQLIAQVNNDFVDLGRISASKWRDLDEAEVTSSPEGLIYSYSETPTSFSLNVSTEGDATVSTKGDATVNMKCDLAKFTASTTIAGPSVANNEILGTEYYNYVSYLYRGTQLLSSTQIEDLLIPSSVYIYHLNSIFSDHNASAYFTGSIETSRDEHIDYAGSVDFNNLDEQETAFIPRLPPIFGPIADIARYTDNGVQKEVWLNKDIPSPWRDYATQVKWQVIAREPFGPYDGLLAFMYPGTNVFPYRDNITYEAAYDKETPAEARDIMKSVVVDFYRDNGTFYTEERNYVASSTTNEVTDESTIGSGQLSISQTNSVTTSLSVTNIQLANYRYIKIGGKGEDDYFSVTSDGWANWFKVKEVSGNKEYVYLIGFGQSSAPSSPVQRKIYAKETEYNEDGTIDYRYAQSIGFDEETNTPTIADAISSLGWQTGIILPISFAWDSRSNELSYTYHEYGEMGDAWTHIDKKGWIAWFRVREGRNRDVSTKKYEYLIGFFGKKNKVTNRKVYGIEIDKNNVSKYEAIEDNNATALSSIINGLTFPDSTIEMSDFYENPKSHLVKFEIIRNPTKDDYVGKEDATFNRGKVYELKTSNRDPDDARYYTIVSSNSVSLNAYKETVCGKNIVPFSLFQLNQKGKYEDGKPLIGYWDEGISYKKDDVVMYKTNDETMYRKYICLKANTGITPGGGEWLLIYDGRILAPERIKLLSVSYNEF